VLPLLSSGEQMKNPIKILNTMTGIEFSVNDNLLAYAKSSPSTFEIIYEDTDAKDEPEVFSESQLKEMSVPELRKLTDGLDCDKRNKDSMINAILKNRG